LSRKISLSLADNEGLTLLAHAEKAGEEGMVKLLLEGGDVDPDTPDRADWTPLSYAAESGHECVVGILLRRAYVNPDIPDCIDRTPLF